MRWALLGLLLALGGCHAQLEDGVYDCSTGACPDGWTCRSDDRCYSAGAPGFALYASCEVDEECDSGACVRPFDATAVLGQCSETCSGSSSCPTVDGTAGVCADGACVRACSTSADCLADMSCLVVPMTPGEHGCMEIVDPAFEASRGCMGQGDCPFPLECVLRDELDTVGICAWPCSPGGECPLEDTCEQLPEAMGTSTTYPARPICLSSCGAMVPGACTMGLSCEPFPGSDAECVPPGWAAP